MKIAKRIFLGVILVLLITSVGGYFWFKRKFQARPNQIAVDTGSYTIRFRWLTDSLANELNPHAGMVFPVLLPGCPRTFYMQFDLGAPSSLFYKNKLDAIRKRYSAMASSSDDNLLTDFSFSVDQMPISFASIKVWTYDSSGIDWADSTGIQIIGTLGSDVIDRKIAMIDYPRQIVSLSESVPDSLKNKVVWSWHYMMLPT